MEATEVEQVEGCFRSPFFCTSSNYHSLLGTNNQFVQWTISY